MLCLINLWRPKGGFMSIKIGINGFGRIGRLVFRAAMAHPEVEVVAINDLSDPAVMAHLLAYDSVHGKLNCPVHAGEGSIEVDGRSIAVTSIKDPDSLDWKSHGVDVVAECTGFFTGRDSASKHLSAGARKVIISAPAKDPDITIVGSQLIPVQTQAASHHLQCILHHQLSGSGGKGAARKFRHRYGLMTTVHAYTGDQRLLDFPHKDLRRARAAALSMVPTTTGAARAVALVLPELSENSTAWPSGFQLPMFRSWILQPRLKNPASPSRMSTTPSNRLHRPSGRHSWIQRAPTGVRGF